MSDHIPDLTKMIGDTPRTDEQINGKPCTRFAILAGDSLRNAVVQSEFARQLERELDVANERIKRLEAAGYEAICPLEYAARVRIWTEAKEAKP